MENRIFDGLQPKLLSIFQTRSVYFYADLVSFLEEKCYSDIEITTKQDIHFYIKEFQKTENENINAYNIYTQLLNSGWLIEYKTGYKIFVDISPDARILLDFLKRFKEYKVRSYGKDVATILSLLESVHDNFQERFHVLYAAEENSHLFLQHLRNTSAHLHIFEEKLKMENDPNNIIKYFFDEYISKNMISDYTRLKVQDNPFRFRFQIIKYCEIISSDSFLKENGTDELEIDLKSIKNSCYKIEKIFSSLETFIQIIDEFNSKIERRIRNTVKYINEINNLDSDNIIKALEIIQSKNHENVKFNELITSLPENKHLLFKNKNKKIDYKPTQIKKSQKSQETIKLEKEILDYFNNTNITAKKLDDFLSERVEKISIKGRDIPIKSLKDFYIFERIRSVEYIEGGILKNRWSVKLLNNVIKNDWIECQDFVISKVEEKSSGED
jgi:hypothetical protein